MTAIVGHQVGYEVGHRVGHTLGSALPAPLALNAPFWFDPETGKTASAPGAGDVAAWMARVGGISPSQGVLTAMPSDEGVRLSLDGGDQLNADTSLLEFVSHGLPESSDWCIYTLFRFDAVNTGGVQTLFCVHNTVDLIRLREFGGNLQAQVNGAFTVSAVSAGQWYWAYMGIQGSTIRARVRGTSEATAVASATANPPTKLDFGNRVLAAQYLSGDLMDQVIFDRWPSAPERAQMQLWADSRMGV